MNITAVTFTFPVTCSLCPCCSQRCLADRLSAATSAELSILQRACSIPTWKLSYGTSAECWHHFFTWSIAPPLHCTPVESHNKLALAVLNEYSYDIWRKTRTCLKKVPRPTELTGIPEPPRWHCSDLNTWSVGARTNKTLLGFMKVLFPPGGNVFGWEKPSQ